MRIVSIAISKHKGTPKTPVEEAEVIVGHGLSGDAHAGDWHRQVSLLAAEAINLAKTQGLSVSFGDFAENVATEGVDWKALPIGTRARLGDSVLLEITQIGKECHTRCAVYHRAGSCIMPTEGVFARVIEGGTIRVGDAVELLRLEEEIPPAPL